MNLDKIINKIRHQISPTMNSLAVTNDFLSINQLIVISAVDEDDAVLNQLATSWKHYLQSHNIKPVNHLIHYIKCHKDSVKDAQQKLNQLYQITFDHDNQSFYEIYAIRRPQGYDELTGQDLLNMTKDF